MTTATKPALASSYRELFAQPVPRRLAVADACARLPQGMVGITLLLVVAQHASMAIAGPGSRSAAPPAACCSAPGLIACPGS